MFFLKNDQNLGRLIGDFFRLSENRPLEIR